MGTHWPGVLLTLSLIALVTVDARGENEAGHGWHHDHRAGEPAPHRGHSSYATQRHEASPCDNGTGPPADKGPCMGPVFQEQPVDTEFFEQLPERSVTLHCCARANPPATYRWTLNDSYIEFSNGYSAKDGNLVISPAERSLHAGIYQCEASSGARTVLSNKATLHFIYLDSFSTASRDMGQGLVENHGVYLLCDPPAHSPGVRFDWLYDDGTNGSASPRRVPLDQRRFVSQSTGGLYFARVEAGDVGRYACLVHMGPPLNKTVTSPFIQLRFRKKGHERGLLPVHLNLRPPAETIVLVGQKLRMECFGLGNPVPSITWRRLNGRGGSERLPAGPVLEIDDVQFSHQGVYECAARNAGGNATARTRVSVHAPPQWTREIPNQNINLGNKLSWRCNASGTPAPSYQWLQNGILLSSQGDRLQVSLDGWLSISNVNGSDEGMYQCVARNDHGEIYSSAQLRVHAFPPEFEHGHPAVVQAVSGGSVEIPCSPRSAPRPSVSWSRSTELLSNGSRMTILANGSLIIRNLEKADARNYTCFAHNPLGKANVTMTLQVKEPTKITRPPSGATVKVGDEVTLQCNAHADPSLDVAFVWMLHERPIDAEAESAHYQRVHGMGDLKIASIQLRHAGTYTCQAQTVVDTASAAADVVVRGPPGPPGGVKAAALNATAARVTWSHGADHHCLITQYSLQHCGKLSAACHEWMNATTHPHYIEGNQESAVVVRLKPWVKYEFRVVARNPCGDSEHSKASAAVRTHGTVPTIVPSGVGGGGGSHRELNITWKRVSEEDHFGDHFQFNVLFRAVNDTEWTTVVVADPNATCLVYQNVSQEPYVPFKVKIQARNDHGVGPYSPEVVVYSAEDEPDVAPRWATAFPFSHAKVNVTWEPILPNATSRRVTGYEIRYWRAEVNQAAAERCRTKTVTDTAIIPVFGRGLDPENRYHVDVRGYNTAGTGPPSPVASVTTLRHEPLVKVVKTKDRVVTFEWQAIHSQDDDAPVTKYQVKYGFQNDSKDYKVNTSKTKLTVQLFENGKYMVTVQAYSNTGRVGSPGKLNFNLPAAGGAVRRGCGACTGLLLVLCASVQLLCSWSL